MVACVWLALTPVDQVQAQSEALAAAQQAEQAGDTGEAIKLYQNFVEDFPNDRFAAAAQFRVGRLYEQQNDFSRAFDAYQKLVDDYPRSEDFDKAIARQFAIATDFLDGRKVRLLGIPVFTSQERSIEMFEQIIESAPFSDYAPLSQYNIGLVKEKQGKPDEAIPAYQAVVDNFPNHDVADDAQYQVGYLYQQEATSGSYDAATRQQAIDAYEDFLNQYPDSEKAAQARDNLQALNRGVTEDAMEVARFYDKRKNYKAAALYYQDVVNAQPGTEEAQNAQQRLDEIIAEQGEQVQEIGSRNPDTGQQGADRRQLRSNVDTGNRPDYVGPPEPAPKKPARSSSPPVRSTPVDVAPSPEFEPNLPE